MTNSRDNIFDLMLEDKDAQDLENAVFFELPDGMSYGKVEYCNEPPLPRPFDLHVRNALKPHTSVVIPTPSSMNPAPAVTPQPTETRPENVVSTRKSARVQPNTAHRWSALLDNDDEPDTGNAIKNRKAEKDDNDEYTPTSSSALSYKLLQLKNARKSSSTSLRSVYIYTKEERDLKIALYKEKKKKSAQNLKNLAKGVKKIKYKCRQDVAKSRDRVGGRFISKNSAFKHQTKEKKVEQAVDFEHGGMRMK